MKKINQEKVFSFLSNLLGDKSKVFFSYDKEQEHHIKYWQEDVINGCGSMFSFISFSYEGLKNISNYMKGDTEEKETIFWTIFLSIAMTGLKFGNEDVETALNAKATEKILGFNLIDDISLKVSPDKAFSIKFNDLDYDFDRDFRLGWNSKFNDNIDFIVFNQLAERSELV